MKLSDLKAKDENSPKHLNTKNISSPMNKTEISISTDQKSPIKPSDFELEISDVIFEMLDELYNPNILYRSTGVTLDNFVQNSQAQLSLFADNETETKKDKLTRCFDKLEEKFGKNIIQTGFIKEDV